MTDGDNLQWTLGPFSTDTTWWGSTQRGRTPLGWTFSPATAFLSPATLSWVNRTRTPMDELIAGPSGVGYIFPQAWPAPSRAPFASLTAEGMRRSSMKLLNIRHRRTPLPTTLPSPPSSRSQLSLLPCTTRGVGVTASWRAACGAGMAVVRRARGAARELAVAVAERKGVEGEVEREVETARC